MKTFGYDLHLHSCLSPCADNDMTVHNIAGMAYLNGLSLIALTDHNSTANCRAFLHACACRGISGIPGMELTTAEEIHVVALFRSLAAAEACGNDLRAYRTLIENRADIFGDQLILDDEDRVVGQERHLLSNATTLSYEEAFAFCRSYDAVVYPAHVDRQSNGVIGILGSIPPFPDFSCLECRDDAVALQVSEETGHALLRLINSDAHVLWDISDDSITMTVPSADPKEPADRCFFETVGKL